MTNKEIVKSLHLVASLMELHGENEFKIKAYTNAAIAIDRFGESLADKSSTDIARISGIGATIANYIQVLINTSTSTLLDELLQKTPDGVVQILAIKGLGAKKVKMLWQDLGIESLGELLYACNENRLLSLKGFGEKTQENIRQTVNYLLANANKYRRVQVEEVGEQVMQKISQSSAIERVVYTGAMRRACEIIERVELLVVGNASSAVENACLGAQLTIQEVLSNCFICVHADGFPFVVHWCFSNEFAFRLWQTTGCQEHINLLAIGSDIVFVEQEKELYERCNMLFVAAELRELEHIGKSKEWFALRNMTLIEQPNLCGIIHAHSTYSDGKNSLEQMAQECLSLGYQYLGISDHSKAAFYANGLSVARIIEQHAEIDLLNKKMAPFRIFKGIEADILHDGSLDYDVDTLSIFDFVIASVHSGLKMNEEKAMTRLMKAIENPYTTILGHPTGRLLLSRLGYPIHHQRIIDACADNNVVIELNANPYRLDLDWRWIDYATKRGVKIAINPDAHSVEGIHDIRHGIMAARKGGLLVQDTFNALNVAEVNAHFEAKRSKQ